MSGKHCDDPLHGITVVVDTAGRTLYLGRYHSEDEAGILLMDAEVRELDDGITKEDFLARSAKFGVFKNTDHVRVPRDEVQSIRRLIEYRRVEES